MHASCKALYEFRTGAVLWDRRKKNDPVLLKVTCHLELFNRVREEKKVKREDGTQLQWLANIPWAKDGLWEYCCRKNNWGVVLYLSRKEYWAILLEFHNYCQKPVPKREMTHSQALHLCTQLRCHVCRELLVVFSNKKTTVRLWEDVGCYV